MDLPDKANCTSGRHEPHGYQGLPEGSVRKGYQGNRATNGGAARPMAVPDRVLALIAARYPMGRPLVRMCYVAGCRFRCIFSRTKFRENARTRQKRKIMTWIRTVSLSEADEKLRQAIDGEKLLYPKEYGDPVHPDPSGASSIVGSHTLIPQPLYHAFSTFGALMSPDLPLARRQHEMIATMVSMTNRCVY